MDKDKEKRMCLYREDRFILLNNGEGRNIQRSKKDEDGEGFRGSS